MEIALTILAQSCGVEIWSGTAISPGRSRLDGPDPMLVIRGPSGTAGRYLEQLRTDPETIEARLGRFLTYYDDNLVRHENAAEVAQAGVFAAVACPHCRQYVNATLGRCPACGQDMDP